MIHYSLTCQIRSPTSPEKVIIHLFTIYLLIINYSVSFQLHGTSHYLGLLVSIIIQPKP
jgi:hypothetical protein